MSHRPGCPPSPVRVRVRVRHRGSAACWPAAAAGPRDFCAIASVFRRCALSAASRRCVSPLPSPAVAHFPPSSRQLRKLSAASRSCELTFRCAAVRCAFAASSASICRTAVTGNSPPPCAGGCCAPADPPSSRSATTASSNTQNGLVTAHAMIPVARGRFIKQAVRGGCMRRRMVDPTHRSPGLFESCNTS